MHIISDCAASLGSRFTLVFDPHGNRLLHNACGGLRERPLRLTAGVRLPGGETLTLPFGGGPGRFPWLEQLSTPTSIEYRGVHPGLWIEFSMKVRAPFYPQDARLSTAPLYYVDLSVRRLERWRGRSCESPLEGGEIVFMIEGQDAEFEQVEGGFRYGFVSTFQPRSTRRADSKGSGARSVPILSFVRAPEAEPEGASCLRKAFDLTDGGTATLGLTWSSWVDAPALEVHGEDTPFKYRQFFESEGAMAQWAGEQREDIERRCDFLDGLFGDWSLGTATANLTSLALHSFLAETWWTTRKDGRDWFSVWAGPSCRHSPPGVEYGNALLYFALWPQLLDMLLEQWSEFEVDAREAYGPEAKGTSFLCRDMGAGHVSSERTQPGHGEVEQNASYLLLLAARTFFGGELELARRKLPLCRRLAEFIVQADTTGSGFPNRGAATALDDASPALRFGRQQVHLAVKAQAALWALAELEGAVQPEGEPDIERWRAFTAKSVKTLDEKGWLGDHFAVTLDRTTEGLVDPHSGEALPEGELAGWDGYCVHAAGGLLYMFLGNIKMPRWKLPRFAMDLESAERATPTPYGSAHAAGAAPIVRVSQNLWRDYVAAYLGIDLLGNAEAYWDLQALLGDNPDASLYADSTPRSGLNLRPAGVAVLGAASSAAGLRLNRVDGELYLAPARTTLRVPLLPLADWKNARVPWLTVRSREGMAVAEISERNLLKGLSVHLSGAELVGS